MQIKGYRQENGKWVYFEEKLNFRDSLKHLYASYWVIKNYYMSKWFE